MSLAIDTDHVVAVMLPDGGWYEVEPKSFDTDSYEFMEGGRAIFAGGQSKETIPSTGAVWRDRSTGQTIYCPLTSVMAVRTA